jgi:hypothetical protein
MLHTCQAGHQRASGETRQVMMRTPRFPRRPCTNRVESREVIEDEAPRLTRLLCDFPGGRKQSAGAKQFDVGVDDSLADLGLTGCPLVVRPSLAFILLTEPGPVLTC